MAKKLVETKTASSHRVSVAWPAFAQNLTDVLGKFEEDQCLLLRVKKSNHYIQFAAQGAFGIRAETTSNAYLGKKQQLDAEQISRLMDAGWHDPTGSPAKATPDADPDGSPNFFIDFPASVPMKAVADVTVRTLTEILRVPHPGYLEYGAFDEDKNQIQIPSLGLRHIKVKPAPTLRQLVLESVADITGIADLAYDEDGDIRLRYESVMVYLRPVDDPPTVQFFSILVEDVKKTPKLFARLNEINADTSQMHLFLRRDAILAISNIPAAPLVSTHLLFVLDHFCQAAHNLSGVLKTEFGRKESTIAPGQRLVIH